MTTLFQQTFNYTKLDNTERGSEQRGIAMLSMVMDFAMDVALDALEINNRAQRDGTLNHGVTKDDIWFVIMGRAKLEDKTICPLMRNTEEQLSEFVFNQLIDEGLANVDDNGRLTATWNPTPIDEIGEEKDEELRDTSLDGVNYPLVSNFSPDRILFFSDNPDMFSRLYPRGNHEMLQVGAKHIREEKVYATSHDNMFLYTLKLN